MFNVILYKHEEDAIPVRLAVEADTEEKAKAAALEVYPKGVFVSAILESSEQ